MKERYGKMGLPEKEILEQVYGESTRSIERFKMLRKNFEKHFGHDECEFFSAPGRSEIIGNHTDHNGGKIIAASINMDTICAAAANGISCVRVISEGYEGEILVELDHLEKISADSGTKALLAGLMEGADKRGFRTGGFDAYVTTEVIQAAGVSSSASFEMLICAVINGLFNGNRMACTDYARIGQYAENIYWNKASGLMDQMACAAGGAVLLDFSDKEQIKYENVPLSFREMGYEFLIVNTGRGHADLSGEYSAIPEEMAEAAAALGVERLCDSDEDTLLKKIELIKNDRAGLRAIHFYEENKRVEKAAASIREKNAKQLLELISESGRSSWELLQNCWSMENPKEQKITRTLALTELFIKKIGDGASRIHGGGFAGVIMCLIPLKYVNDYKSYISKYVGEENIYSISIRRVGAVQL